MGLGGGWGLSVMKLANNTMASKNKQMRRIRPDDSETDTDSENEMYTCQQVGHIFF